MALVVRGLSKAYGAKRVLEGVDLAVEAGQIHALLGPNGSGKSTLIRCLSGAIVPDAGVMIVGGDEHHEFDPREAIRAGTSVIYQHFSLVPNLTVADNVFLGDERRTGMRIDHAQQDRETARLLDQFGRSIRPGMLVSSLSIGDRQLVEIAKALHRDPKLVVLDEPTAALGEQESTQLINHLRGLRDAGLAILYVTHIISEVFAIADRVTVLRDGHVVLSDEVSRVNPAQVIAAISPGASSSDEVARAPLVDGEASVLELDGVRVDGVGPATFNLRSGEIIAVFGLLGSGRTELVEGIYGVRRIQGGELRMRGRPFKASSPRAAVRAGIVLVAGDRIRQSIFDKLSAGDNLLLPHFAGLSRWFVRRSRTERKVFHDTADGVRLQPNNPRVLAWALSGGNQQKLAVGRWLAAIKDVTVLLLDEPTQGIDVGARRDLYELLRRLARAEGKAILFTSSDPEETLALADRVLVLRRGRIVAELPRGECTERLILSIAHGAENMADAATSPSAA
jgi:ribose transport system ATP-binding protein